MNSNKVGALLALVEDPTDFPATVPSLRTLDAAVRCPICSEYFAGPVSLLCGHCFCSLCIRNAIATPASKAQCPTCRTHVSESQLRPNPGMEDVVSAWQLARPCVLSLASKQQEEDAVGEPAKKRRRLDDDSSSVAGPSRTSSTESASKSDADVSSSSAPPGEGHVPKPDFVVACPLCTQSMKYKFLETHMTNNCAPVSPSKPSAPPTSKSKSQKNAWSDIMAPKSKGKDKDKDTSDADHIPKVSYDTLKDRQLKDKLVELGLPAGGDRAAWIARHQRWSMLWNANLDRAPAKRQSKAELLKELRKWEEERAALRSKQKREKEKEKPDDHEHLKTHNAEFKKLVAAARPKSKGGAASKEMEVQVSIDTSPPPSSAVVPSSRLNSEADVIVVDSDDEDEKGKGDL